MAHSNNQSKLAIVKAIGAYLSAHKIPITDETGKANDDVQKVLNVIVESWHKQKHSETIASLRSILLRSELEAMRKISPEELLKFIERAIAA